jgi:DNA-binding CsgD family transcriptional regulator/GAF domain-containing protein
VDHSVCAPVARFAELVCGTLRSATVQQQGLPEFTRLTGSDSGAIHLLDHRYRATLASMIGAPIMLLYEFEELNRRTSAYFRRSFTTRFPIHDVMLHSAPEDHRGSPEGKLLAKYGFEHCMFVPLIRNGRAVGTITVARAAGRPAFTLDEQHLADRLARFAALALANAGQHEAATGPDVAEEALFPLGGGATRPVPDTGVLTVRLRAGRAAAVNAGTPHRLAGIDDVLTAREIEVLELVAGGLTNMEIANELSIAVNTVKQHVKHIYRKLGARSRFDALRLTRDDGRRSDR